MKTPEVKMGHGGTLDPLASGILIIGILNGTKDLHYFLGNCTKTYEATILFGAETDTHDCLGKIVRKRGFGHVTREIVEEKLGLFRGRFLQNPPLFSALKYKGKKLYEYAREGKVPPVTPEPRPVDVSNLEIVEWFEPGMHEFRWPEEAPKEEREAAERILGEEDSLPVAAAAASEGEKVEIGGSSKRKSPSPVEGTRDTTDSAPASKKQKLSTEGDSAQTEPQNPTTTEPSPTQESEPEPETKPTNAQPPAVKIRMTVSSGFYVRSLAHDLGKAVDSCGIMTSLVRTQQGDYILEPGKVLEYKDLDEGEDVWGPKVKRFLTEWDEKKAAGKKAAEAEAGRNTRNSSSPEGER